MRQKQLVPEVVAAPLKALSSSWSLGFHPSTSSLPPHHASFQSSPVLLCSLTTFTSSLSKISFIICFQPTMQLPWHIHIYTFFSPSAILRSFYHNTFYQNDNIHLEDRSKQHQVESLSELPQLEKSRFFLSDNKVKAKAVLFFDLCLHSFGRRQQGASHTYWNRSNQYIRG